MLALEQPYLVVVSCFRNNSSQNCDEHVRSFALTLLKKVVLLQKFSFEKKPFNLIKVLNLLDFKLKYNFQFTFFLSYGR